MQQSHAISYMNHGYNTILIPCNLYGKHWVGLLLSREEESDTVRVTYTDSESKPMPLELLTVIEQVISHGYNMELKQQKVAQQTSSNCGPELVENFVDCLTGNRLHQEKAVGFHSLLFELELLANDMDQQSILLGNEITQNTEFLM